MGKRSDFPRIDRDYYRTIDSHAVAVLAPFLKPGVKFIEPCAGAGDLIDQLQDPANPFPNICVGSWDINPRGYGIAKADALELNLTERGADCIITNPPWSRPVLHELIEHLSKQLPTWLLFDSDWAYTEQKMMANKYGVKPATELMKHCRKIVAVGRLKWIPGTTMKGKENCSWYLFDQNAEGQTEFFGRAAA